MEHWSEIGKLSCIFSFYLQDEDVACQGVLDKLTNDQKFIQKKFDEIMGNIQKAKQHHEKLVKEYEV